MKYIITTYMPCTAEEYIVLKDDIDYKNFQVRVSLFLSPNPTSQDTVRAAWGRGGMKRRAFSNRVKKKKAPAPAFFFNIF